MHNLLLIRRLCFMSCGVAVQIVVTLSKRLGIQAAIVEDFSEQVDACLRVQHNLQSKRAGGPPPKYVQVDVFHIQTA